MLRNLAYQQKIGSAIEFTDKNTIIRIRWVHFFISAYIRKNKFDYSARFYCLPKLVTVMIENLECHLLKIIRHLLLSSAYLQDNAAIGALVSAYTEKVIHEKSPLTNTLRQKFKYVFMEIYFRSPSWSSFEKFLNSNASFASHIP